MEKYKKIIGSLLFAVITLAMLYGTANLLRDRETTLADLYSEEKGSIDMVIVGSSHVNNGIIPNIFWEENGISVVQRMGANGSYRVVVYDLKAQHFLLDNLDAVIDRENAQAALQGRPWDPEQDRRLAELHRSGASYGEIAVVLQRSTSAIRSRLKKQGLLETK